MKLVIEGGQGGWLPQVHGPDEQGCLGVVWTGADALRKLGMPVEDELSLALTEAPGGLPQPRDAWGRYLDTTSPASGQTAVEETSAKQNE